MRWRWLVRNPAPSHPGRQPRSFAEAAWWRENPGRPLLSPLCSVTARLRDGKHRGDVSEGRAKQGKKKNDHTSHRNRPHFFFFTALSSPWIPTCWSRAWLARPLWILWLAFLPHHVHDCFWSHSVTQVQRQLSKNTLDANSERLTTHGWGGSDVHHERGIHINGWRGKTPPQWLIGWWSSKPTTGFCFLSEFLASIETSCSYPYFICVITSLTWFPPCLLAYIFEWCTLKLFILI